MTTPYYTDAGVTLHLGDALDILRTLEPESANSIVTSPPYYGLRDYGVDGQYGLEASPAEYVETMRAVFAEARRVLANDGTLWLNLGDSYYSGRGNPGPNSGDTKQPARRGWVRAVDRPGQSWGTPKSLLGVPWRVAFALQDDGWILRNAIIWNKPNAMPESVTDRLATRYEHLFLFTRSPRYWFDLEPIKIPTTGLLPGNTRAARLTYSEGRGRADGTNPGSTLAQLHETRNPGDVWTLPTQPFPGAHFAVMPLELARRCIAAGCRPGGTVLDPFSGSGTTGAAAAILGRRYIGIDLRAEYHDLALASRLAQPALLDDVGGTP